MIGAVFSGHAAPLPDGRVLILDTTGAQLFDPATETFTFAGNFVSPRAGGGFAATGLADGRVLVTGGLAGLQSTTAHAEMYDPATGAFSSVGDMTTARSGHSATRLADGRVLVAGGSVRQPNAALILLQSAELFDPATGVFTSVAPMTVARSGPTGLLLADGRVLLSDPGAPTADLFNPATGTFRATANVAARGGDEVIRLADGRVLSTGGSGAAADTTGAEARIYDPATEAVTLISPMVHARIGHRMTLLPDGRVLVSGGTTLQTGQWLPAEIFDSATGAFTETATLRMFRVDHTATLLPDGRVLLAGGTTQSPSAELFIPGSGAVGTPPSSCPTAAAFRPTGTEMVDVGLSNIRAARLTNGQVLIVSIVQAQVYDPRTQSFTFAADLITPRQLANFEVTALADGRALVTGGLVGPGNTTTAHAEIYDPATHRFTPAADMTTARGLHSATALGDGRVLIAGGDQAGSDPSIEVILESAEVFDPASGAFVAVGPMTVNRVAHQSVLLADGRVLLAGGPVPGSSDGSARLDADLFDPVTGTFRATAHVSMRTEGRLVRLRDGRVLNTGGYFGPASAAASIYDPVTETDTPIAPMVYARWGHTSTLLDDGSVLIAGGSGVLPAEIFDPSAGAFTEIATLRIYRVDHTATRLADGTVLLAGPPNTFPSAELFIPASP